MQHAAALAARCAAQLAELLASGRGMAPAGGEQQGGGGGGGASSAGEDDSVWMRLFVTPLAEMDVLLLLRKEALPTADRALPAAAAALAKHVSRLRRGSSSHKRRRADEASAALQQRQLKGSGSTGVAAPKQARAVLRGFPQQVVDSTPAAQLASELLVGFDPLPLFLAALEERFGHLATFCADAHGLPAVGVRWRAEAFLPAPLAASTAHATLELSLSCARGSSAAGLVVPNVAQAVAEMGQLGVGLVEEVLLADAELL